MTAVGRIAIIFERIGPYHMARLEALRRRVSVHAFELTNTDTTYAWENSREDRGVVTLFPEVRPHRVRPRDLERRIARELDASQAEAVALPGYSEPFSLAALEWSLARDKPAVLMADSTPWDSRRTRTKEALKRRIIAIFDSALVAGTPHADYLQQLGLSRERIFLGYDVVDNAHFATDVPVCPTERERQRKLLGLPDHYFITVARFVEKKNLMRLLAAYARYRQLAGGNAWGLVLVGSGPLDQRIAKEVERLGIARDIRLPGFLQYDQLPLHYALGDVYIQPSTVEQWGLAVNEAMAAGLPVLVSERCGCARDLVQSGHNGFVFDPYQVNELAKVMLDVSANDCDRIAMGRSSQRIISGWTPDTFAKNLVRAANAALSTPRKRHTWTNRLLLKLLIRR